MFGCKSVATPLVANDKWMKEDGEKKVNASLYRSLVGTLFYLTATRPDIMFAASFLSRFMQSPSQIHFGAAKRVWRYLQGTIGYGIWYNYSSDLKLVGYSDSDWAGSADDMRSASGYAFFLGSGLMGLQEATNCSSILSRGRICGCVNGNFSSNLASKNFGRCWPKSRRRNRKILRQQISHCHWKESSLPQPYKTHSNQVSLHKRSNREWWNSADETRQQKLLKKGGFKSEREESTEELMNENAPL